MFTLLKLILLGAVIAGVILFTPIGAGVRAKVGETVNPMTKQSKVLGAATENLQTISDMAQNGDLSSLPPAKFAELTSALNSAETNLAQAQTIAGKTDLAAVVSNLISSIAPSNTASSCPQQ